MPRVGTSARAGDGLHRVAHRLQPLPSRTLAAVRATVGSQPVVVEHSQRLSQDAPGPMVNGASV
jgi:hypothetical protein